MLKDSVVPGLGRFLTPSRLEKLDDDPPLPLPVVTVDEPPLDG